jgi:N-glycosylase/DNA lyase
MKLKAAPLRELQELYQAKKSDIVQRLEDFRKFRQKRSDNEIFRELAFCLFTPQSKAKSCWASILNLDEHDLLFRGSAAEIREKLHCVRFHNKKAEYLVRARTLFLKNGKLSLKPVLNSYPDIRDCREWLVKNLTGLGYKEASHFLRNIGFGENIAILDRHILRNLCLLGVIPEIPESLGRTKYLLIEKDMAEFSNKIAIPLSHLDLLLWYKETGEIFK